MIIAILVLMIMLCVRITGFVIRMAGKLLGGALGILGYLIVGVIAAALLKTAISMIPVILVVGLLVIGYQLLKNNRNSMAV